MGRSLLRLLKLGVATARVRGMGGEIESVRVVEVRALEEYRVWLRYNDGVEGVVDLSDMVEYEPFEPWKDKEFFETAVRVDEWGSIRWSDDLDFCRTALYMEITGKPPEEVLTGRRKKALVGA